MAVHSSMEDAGRRSPGTSPTSSAGRRDHPSRHSILAGNSGRSSRIDSFGNTIEKGKKLHRCTFVDERDPRMPVEEKIEVTSFKGVHGGWDTYDSQPSCGCVAM
mmetsp:Transcript_97145/g.258147  ORF Transcript_97145/g.258147 Transcript_97145/m.258147 type:complete len:104 (-) Transcript_97145:79-390(-)